MRDGLSLVSAAETEVEVLAATQEATLVDLVLGIPDAASCVLGIRGLLALDRLTPHALAQRTEAALHDAQRLLASLELGRRAHAARSRRSSRLRSPRDIARFSEPTLPPSIAEVPRPFRSPTPGASPLAPLSFRALPPAPRPRPARVASLTRRV
ncbi:hypothetical protein [Sorangium sp. So ce1389]|uniref:hypothetical protein n=1 Tax=Sorangium sp. So ce1389 TaxID=3133336 RepID=UPI003F632B61